MIDKEVPGSWLKTTIGELFEFVGGGTPSKKVPEYWGGSIPWASVKDIKTKYLLSTIDYITELGLEKSAANLAEPGDLIILTRIEPGKAALVKNTVAVNQDCKIGKPSAAVSAEWAYYYFLANENEFRKRSSGTTVLGISLKELKTVPVLLPPLSEQHRIVAKIEELFSELDKGVESLKVARAQLKTYRQSLLQAAFEGRLTEQWRHDNPHRIEPVSRLLKDFGREKRAHYQNKLKEWEGAVSKWKVGGESGRKPSKPSAPKSLEKQVGHRANDDDLPANWRHFSLGDIILEIDQGWSPKCKPHPSLSEKVWGVIKTTSIQPMRFEEEENKALPDELSPKQSLEIFPGDILVTRAGPRSRVGVCCRVPSVRKKLMICDKVYRLRFPEAVIDPRYMELALNSPRIVAELEGLKSGINDSGVNLTQGRFLSLRVPVPPIQEQKIILEIVEAGCETIFDLEGVVESEIERVDVLRQAILNRALGGALVTQNSDDEPASALLERIDQEQLGAPKLKRRNRETGAPA